MSRNKQIDEMAETILYQGDNYDTCCKYDCETIASLIYNKGYRKASDVAREIFEEIEKTLNRKLARSKPRYEELNCNEGSLSIWGHKDMGYFQGIISTAEDIQDFIAELKKKYTEEGK